MVDEVGMPRLDGTAAARSTGVPFQLSRRPSAEWVKAFVHAWNHPPSFTTMHRPGIASVAGDTIVLDGTTIDEVHDVHRNTLVLVINETNRAVEQQEREAFEREQAQLTAKEEHERRVRAGAKKLTF